METRRTKRLISSIVFGLGGQFLTVIAPILMMPAMLLYLGDVGFGAWLTSVSIASLMVFLDFGIGNVLLTRLSAAKGTGDLVSARKDIATAYSIIASVAIIGVALLFFMFHFGAADLVFPSDSLGVVYPVLVLFFVGMPFGIIYRILYARQSIPLVSALQSVGALGSVICGLAAIWLSASAWVVVTLFAGAPIMVMLLGTIWFFRSNPDLMPRFIDFVDLDVKRMIGFGWQFFLLSILTSIGLNSDIIIISIVAGPAEVANFALPMRIGLVLSLLVTNLFMPLWSFNGDALARGDVAWVRRNALNMSLGGSALVFLIGCVLVLFVDQIMALWVGRQFEHQTLVLAAMTLTYSLMAFTSPYNMILNAKGMARVQIAPWLIFLVVSLIAKLVLVDEGRAWVAPSVTFVCYLAFIAPAMFFLARRSLR